MSKERTVMLILDIICTIITAACVVVNVYRGNFDVAILGCGPFGFHLAMEIKRMGKQAIVMGGATQILFGIKGKRWDDYPPVRRLYNEFWVRPLDKSKPATAV